MVTVLFYVSPRYLDCEALGADMMLDVVKLAHDKYSTTITLTNGTCFAATGEWDNVSDLFAHLDKMVTLNFWVLELNDESQQRRRWKSSMMGYSHKTKPSC